MTNLRPFLKWAGGKHRLLDRINRKLPAGDRHRRLLEPFVGSGAVFMGTDYPAYLLADSNPDLINVYRQLQQDGEWFIDYLRRVFANRTNTRECYDRVRDNFNQVEPHGSAARAASFVWLNRHCFNGLCRYNQRGGFNVPFGRYKSPAFPEAALRAFAAKLSERDVELRCQSFTQTLSMARDGDVVYCDPPYVPLSATASFTAYTAVDFGPNEQLALSVIASETAERGIPVVVSNHSERSINKLYRDAGARLSFFNVRRSISCKGSNRKPARELLALWEAA